jgi:triosephosphate isomerase
VQDFKIFVNFKTYSESTGENSLKLAEICLKQAKEKNILIIPVVQAVDLFRVTSKLGGQVWVQHIDDATSGKFTGLVTTEAIAIAQGKGTLLNHSEHPIPPGTVKQIVVKAKNKGLQTMICAKTLGQLKRLIKLKPDFMGYEISEFIGTNVSITDASPKSIIKAVGICGEIPLIIGAGINKKEDLVKAKQMGAQGVLISSSVVLAENQELRLKELLSAIV